MALFPPRQYSARSLIFGGGYEHSIGGRHGTAELLLSFTRHRCPCAWQTVALASVSAGKRVGRLFGCKHCNRAGLLHNGKRAERQKWEKIGKTWKICPDRKWGKNGRKIPKKWKKASSYSWRTFRIFVIFFLLGEGEGGVRGARGGGGSIFIENPTRGGGFRRGRGAGRVSAANWGIWGGGPKYFFSGPKRPPSITGAQKGSSTVLKGRNLFFFYQYSTEGQK